MRLLVALLILFGAPALATPEPVATADVTRDEGNWTVEYRLDAKAPVWVFARSDLPRVKKQSWRLDTMKALTPRGHPPPD